jgi:hypothetical protein
MHENRMIKINLIDKSFILIEQYELVKVTAGRKNNSLLTLKTLNYLVEIIREIGQEKKSLIFKGQFFHSVNFQPLKFDSQLFSWE